MSDRLTPGHEDDLTQVKKAMAELEECRAIPAAEFPGHKGVACANLEGFLGSRVPALVGALEHERTRSQGLEEALRDYASRVQYEAKIADANGCENVAGNLREATLRALASLSLGLPDDAPESAAPERPVRPLIDQSSQSGEGDG